MKTRNKKRLITLVLVFALVFLTGAAFAFADGILDIVGTVNISAPDDLYVIWYDVGYEDPMQVQYATQTATIVDRDGPGAAPNALQRTDQRILWNVLFDGHTAASDEGFTEAMAILHATARNMSNVDAEITAVRVRWINANVTINNEVLVPDGAATFDPAAFGLRYTIAPGTINTTPVGLNGHATTTLIITLNWDGTLPDGFFENPASVPPGEPFAVGTPVLAGYFVIEFDYGLATP